MRNSIFLFAACLLLTTGCLKDQCSETATFVRFDPVYVSEAELDAEISVSESKALENPGIIYAYGKYLLVNELHQGVHVIDNSDPSNPQPVSFIEIAGNEHFAVTKNQLQANRYNSLVTVDISDPTQPMEKSRIHNAFQELYFHDGRGYLAFYRRSNQHQILDCADPNFNSPRWSNGTGGPIFFRQDFANRLEASVTANDVGTGSTGVGGSTARFTITKEHMYAVTQYDMKIFDLEDACQPRSVGSVNLGWGIETIYPFQDKLFIGSESGMFIYDISAPSSPVYRTSFSHARACDPVVTDGETAYVTLRDGTRCQGFANQLDVVDVTDVSFPSLIQSYPMENPHGLAIRGEFLYVCEGTFGLKVLDRTGDKGVKELAHLKDLDARDIIVLSDELALVVGQDGIIQLSLENPARPKQISQMLVNRTII